ncbi:uncharacterized protein LOC131061889 [Cryptomeria japonica]|uniref:uncharacterized protein LOC131061889 n=1 Tax=Cryptomeria japonica TaxID=3369 RepID=UPI0025ACF2DC|nr:uncharacterized protein LOC131061889 [Cryptomeria japonica]
MEDGRRNGDGENYGNRINTNKANHVGNNGCGIDQNKGQNRGNNGNYGSGNGGGRNNGNNNGNINGGGSNGNNGNYSKNNGIMKNQRKHHVGRQALIIERYRQLDFTGIVGYPNQITNDLRLSIPKFSRNGVDSAEKHVINVKNIIEEFEIPHEDVFMKLLVQSLIEDVGDWKVAGKVAKRDDPKLYNSRVYRKDDLTKIMDMLKDLKGLVEDEEDKNEDYEPTVNAFSFDPYWGRNEDLSEEEEYSDVYQRRENLQYGIQHIFSNDDEDTPTLRKLFQEEIVPSLRNLTEEEKKAFTVATIEQVESNYQPRNRNVNNE